MTWFLFGATLLWVFIEIIGWLLRNSTEDYPYDGDM
jgi:hypothetical protein